MIHVAYIDIYVADWKKLAVIRWFSLYSPKFSRDYQKAASGFLSKLPSHGKVLVRSSLFGTEMVHFLCNRE